MVLRIVETESLADRAKRWRAALSDADCGPLIIADEVMTLAAQWPSHQEEAQGLSINQWLCRTLGRGKTFAWFKRRAHAVEVLDPSIRRTFNHHAAVWVAYNVKPEDHRRCVFELTKAARLNGGNPVSLNVAVRLVRDLLGIKSVPKKCERCELLERALAAAGVAVPV